LRVILVFWQKVHTWSERLVTKSVIISDSLEIQINETGGTVVLKYVVLRFASDIFGGFCISSILLFVARRMEEMFMSPEKWVPGV
jgi:hypothetical protein